MTAKETARDLLHKYDILVGLKKPGEAKICAIIAVDIILKELTFELFHTKRGKILINYWKNVKNEIKK